jgi:hypothetical protein
MKDIFEQGDKLMKKEKVAADAFYSKIMRTF